MVAREPYTPPSPLARQARPRPRQGKRPGSEAYGGSAGSRCSSGMRDALQEMQELRVPRSSGSCAEAAVQG